MSSHIINGENGKEIGYRKAEKNRASALGRHAECYGHLTWKKDTVEKLLCVASSLRMKDTEELKEILFLILLPLYYFQAPPQDLCYFACRYLTFDPLYYFLFMKHTERALSVIFLSSMKIALAL